MEPEVTNDEAVETTPEEVVAAPAEEVVETVEAAPEADEAPEVEEAPAEEEVVEEAPAPVPEPEAAPEEEPAEEPAKDDNDSADNQPQFKTEEGVEATASPSAFENAANEAANNEAATMDVEVGKAAEAAKVPPQLNFADPQFFSIFLQEIGAMVTAGRIPKFLVIPADRADKFLKAAKFAYGDKITADTKTASELMFNFRAETKEGEKTAEPVAIQVLISEVLPSRSDVDISLII